MTQYSKHEVINNLRREKKKLENTLEAVTSKVKEWNNPHQRDKHAAPSIVHDLEGLLELPQEGDEE
jgi:hypothetical protein